MQGQQLLTENQVFEDEILPGTESANHPAEDMPDRHDHGKNLIGTVRSELFAKSFILWVCDVLARTGCIRIVVEIEERALCLHGFKTLRPLARWRCSQMDTQVRLRTE